ncbi:MAG TPA: hypothetical protein VIL08_02640 [Limnochorda sp.]
MKVAYGDIWQLYDQGMAVVIPTNMCKRQNGEAVMGAGLARQATERFPWLAKQYGELLHCEVPRFIFPEHRLILIPTKRDWREPSPLSLVEEGVRWLQKQELLFAAWNWEVAVPPLGCGLGGLPFEKVRPILEQLSDRFYLVLRRQAFGPLSPRPSAF